jgi:hypothetical protein
MIEHVHQQLATWKEGETRDMYGGMKRISLGCVAKSRFSADFGAAAVYPPTGARHDSCPGPPLTVK